MVLDSRNGGVLAISGGRDYRFSQFNRATMALRQPGSTFKLMVYLAALERGISPAAKLNCERLEWGGQRFESDCQGQLSLLSAFAFSNNTAAPPGPCSSTGGPTGQSPGHHHATGPRAWAGTRPE